MKCEKCKADVKLLRNNLYKCCGCGKYYVIKEEKKTYSEGDPRQNSCKCGWRGKEKVSGCPVCHTSFVE